MAQQPGIDLDALAKQYGGTVTTAPLTNDVPPPPAPRQPAPNVKQPAPLVVGRGAERITGPRTWSESIRENLPAIGGMIGGTLGSFGGPASGFAGAAEGAALGESGKQMWRASTPDLPVPPTLGGRMLDIGKEAIVSGVVPEAIGQGTGRLIRKGGDIATRYGAAGRNVGTLDRAANPDQIPLKPSLGQNVQSEINSKYASTKQPLESEYDRQMQGKFGQATELIRNQGKFAKGDTIAQMHKDKADVLALGRTARDSNAQRAPLLRGERTQAANAIRARMETTAKRHGMDMKDYDAVSTAWGEMEAKFNNSMVKNVRTVKTGTNVVDYLSKPQSWSRMRGRAGDTPFDTPQKLAALKSVVSPQSYKSLQAAVSKNILGGSQINPVDVIKRLDLMEKHGVMDLVPNQQILKQYMQILQKHGDAIKVPNVFRNARFVNNILAGMGEPDLARFAKRANGGGDDVVTKLVTLLGRAGAEGGRAAYEETTHSHNPHVDQTPNPDIIEGALGINIPNPPR